MKKQVSLVLLTVFGMSSVFQIRGQGIGGIQYPGYIYWPTPGGAYGPFGQELNTWKQPGYKEKRRLSLEEINLLATEAHAELMLVLIREERRIREQVGLSEEEKNEQIVKLKTEEYKRFWEWRHSLS